MLGQDFPFSRTHHIAENDCQILGVYSKKSQLPITSPRCLGAQGGQVFSMASGPSRGGWAGTTFAPGTHPVTHFILQPLRTPSRTLPEPPPGTEVGDKPAPVSGGGNARSPHPHPPPPALPLAFLQTSERLLPLLCGPQAPCGCMSPPCVLLGLGCWFLHCPLSCSLNPQLSLLPNEGQS